MSTSEIAADLRAEQAALDAVVAPLTDQQWRTPTASPRWTVAHQVAHLAYFDDTATVAITDPERFADLRAELVHLMAKGDEEVDSVTLGPYLERSPSALLAVWRTNRERLGEAAATLPDDGRVEWYGPSMSGRSFLTARLMECWAHGQDVVDAVGGDRPPTDRLRHIAHLGFITRDWSFINRGENPPPEPIRVELTAPSGDRWTFGPDDATETVVGTAEEFCLVVTQRRHLDDTSLAAGPLGSAWLLRAQAFAGPATDGPPPGGRD